MTQQIYLAPRDQEEWPWHIRHEVLQAVDSLKKDRGEQFSLLDIGATHNPFNQEYLTHTFDIIDSPREGVHAFLGNMNRYEDWQQLLDYVDEHGKFTFCNCTHTLEDLANPMLAIEMMPRIAEQGFLAMPSKYNELQRREGPFRGTMHHRWIWNNENGRLIAYPKIPIIDSMTFYPNEIEIERNAEVELRMFWISDIDFAIVNNDYLGPTAEAIYNIYRRLLP
jgi:hypothetical protein